MDFKLKKSELNFRVYTATEPPETGNENDICVISSVPMKNWILSPDAPNGKPRTDGDVWLQYSVSGNTFNAAKNNSMIVAMVTAYQYVSGAWVNVEAKSYNGGAWVEWYNGELFKDGRQYTDITGGWADDGYMYYRASYVHINPTIGNTIIVDASKMVGASTENTSIAGTQKAIDVTDKTALRANVLSVTGACYLVVTDSNKNTHSSYARRVLALTTAGNVSMDISDITGEVFIAVVAVYTTSSMKNTCEVSSIVLE